MKKILYINYGVTKECGVYDLGLRHFNAIKDIEDFSNYIMVYAEVNGFYEYISKLYDHTPDLVIINYLAGLSPWLQDHISVCPTICVPHDMRAGDYNLFRRDDLFDYYIILDKNIQGDDKIFNTDRPLKFYDNLNVKQNKVPNIGSFGFALTHKNFHLIVRQVNKEFDEAEINFHMPKAYYDHENQTPQVIKECVAEITKPGIKLNITHDFLSEDEVIEQLGKNDINCLFYDKDRDLGISSSLDFLMSAQKPILITQSPMFRSFSGELPKLPETTLMEIWNNYENYRVNVRDTFNSSHNNILVQTKTIFDKVLN